MIAVLRDPEAAPQPRPLPDLGDEGTRERLTPASLRALVRLAEAWRLPARDIAVLAGFSERNWARVRGGAWTGVLGQDQMTRASALVGIFKGLHLLFSDPLADDWVRLPNRDHPFAGRSPVEAMKAGGIPVMIEVRRYVDALRGGL